MIKKDSQTELVAITSFDRVEEDSTLENKPLPSSIGGSRTPNEATLKLFDLLRQAKEKSRFKIHSDQLKEAFFDIPEPADITYTDEDGLNVLHYAAWGGHKKVCGIFIQLLKQSSDEVKLLLNQKDKEGNTPLIIAIIFGKKEIVSYLLRKGADVFALGPHGMTCLHIAARYDRVEIIPILFNHVGVTPLPLEWETPQFQRVKITADPKGKKGSFKLVYEDATVDIDEDSDLRLKHLDSKKPRAKLLDVSELNHQQKMFRDRVDALGHAPLYFAAFFNRERAARLLLQIGADPAFQDFYGETPLLYLSYHMPHVAEEALESYTIYDKDQRMTRYYLGALDPPYNKAKIGMHNVCKIQSSVHTSLFDTLIDRRRYKLFMAPAMKRFVELAWRHYGKKFLAMSLSRYLIFLVTWSVIAMGDPQRVRSDYHGKGWRLGIEAFGILQLIAYIVGEIWEMVHAYHKEEKMIKFFRTRFQGILGNTNPTFPDYGYLKAILASMRCTFALRDYLSDPWNFLDWLCYFSLSVSVLLGFGVMGTDPESTNTQIRQVQINHARFLVFGLIFAYVRLLKFGRAFKTMGPFAVILLRTGRNIFDFVMLYFVLLIPFGISFVLIFKESEVVGYSSFAQSLVSLFRMSLVDFDYDSIEAADGMMGPLLVCLWLFFAGVLFFNLFIAMMTNTFQNVYDHAKQVAMMQRAEFLQSARESFFFGEHIRAFESFIEAHQYISEHFEELEDEPDSIYQSLRLDIADQVDTIERSTARHFEEVNRRLDTLGPPHGHGHNPSSETDPVSFSSLGTMLTQQNEKIARLEETMGKLVDELQKLRVA